MPEQSIGRKLLAERGQKSIKCKGYISRGLQFPCGWPAKYFISYQGIGIPVCETCLKLWKLITNKFTIHDLEDSFIEFYKKFKK